MERPVSSTVTTSDAVATATVLDGFTVDQSDYLGGNWSFSHHYNATGILSTQTDSRGITTSTQTDIAGRPIIQTDGEGNETTTTYTACCDQPASISDALGNTVNYKYDIRNRKIAESPRRLVGGLEKPAEQSLPEGRVPNGVGTSQYGTGIQPATYSYDSADRMTTLRTFRVDNSTITTDPTGRTDGDTTTWAYHDATGLQLSKTFADGTQELRSYDALNKLVTITNARRLTQTFAYNSQTAELASQNFASSPDRNYSYNHLGQLHSVSDESGRQQLSYNNYSELLAESTSIANQSYSRIEQYDNVGSNTGYQLQRDGSTIHQNRYAYDNRGRIATAGFYHANTWEDFTYSYLNGTSILSTLEHPSGIVTTRSYEPNRNLLTSIVDSKNGTTLSNKVYSYDAIGRPTARTMNERSDTFAYDSKSQLTAAQLGSDNYGYSYDNIGNRKTAQEIAEEITYATNSTNEYTAVNDFTPEFDADGNQTRLQTSTGIWNVEYNAENRPVKFTSADGNTIVEARYDYMGRRAWKKVTVNGKANLHEAYIYRGYLQIAAIDLRGANAGHFITWDPTQPTATRPLALEKHGTWYFCPARPAAQANPSGVPSGLGVDCSSSINGLDLSKNVTELYSAEGTIATSYQYSPFGAAEATGSESTLNPIQWSSEIVDKELGLVYYNYRHYNPADGRWINRDPIAEAGGMNLYGFVGNRGWQMDALGLDTVIIVGSPSISRDGRDGRYGEPIRPRHDQSPWNFIRVAINRSNAYLDKYWDPKNKCCKNRVYLVIYSLGYKRRYEYDKTNRSHFTNTEELSAEISSRTKSFGNKSKCLSIKYFDTSKEILSFIKELKPNSISNLDYIGHSNDAALFVEYGSEEGKNDGHYDSEGPDGDSNTLDDAYSKDMISNQDLIDAVAGKFKNTKTQIAQFSHLGCHGGKCAFEMGWKYQISTRASYGKSDYTKNIPNGLEPDGIENVHTSIRQIINLIFNFL